MNAMVSLLLVASAQDTVAYVAKQSGPPATESYMWAGYAITLIVLLGYIVLLARRIARSRPS